MIVNLPVSIGEALDKLSILDIKLKKIKDERKLDVKKEYTLLYTKLEELLKKNKFYYKLLVDINLNIWDMQDEFRYSNDDNLKNKLCKKIIEENDRRFRIKKKINDNSSSELKEQKGYKLKKVFILTHLLMGDHLTTIGMVRYFSTLYDNVTVACYEDKINNLKDIYSDDKSINFYKINKIGRDIINFDRIFDMVTKDYDKVVTCGNYKFCKDNVRYQSELYINKYHLLPMTFYMDVNIPTSIFWDYFHVPILPEAIEAYNLLKKKNRKYIFMHSSSSSWIDGKGHNVFNVDDVYNYLNIPEGDRISGTRQKYIVIDPCTDQYGTRNNSKDKKIAKKLRNLPLLHYTEIIKNADIVFLTDSSFSCLSFNLEIKTDQCYIKPRGLFLDNYSHIWNPKFKFGDHLKRRVFKHVDEF